VLVDATASMGQADAGRPHWSRLDAARALTACVLELAVRQGDRFGVAAIGPSLRLVPAGAGPRHRDRCLHELAGVRAGGAWPGEVVLRPLWERIGAGQLALLLSDDFDDGAVALMARLSAARREVLNVQLLTVGERDFPFRGGHRFRDPETGAELVGAGAASRAGFLARFAAARAELDARLTSAGVRRVEHVLDEPLDAPLRRLFAPSAAERA
jgi:uncharacterized protein (DUF58 family)